jgi:hypothetical protein
MRRPTDEPLSGAQLVRRVSVTLEVYFCGTFVEPAMAHAEAWARVEEAIEHAGGLVSLRDVRSVLGRYTAPAAQGAPQLAGGRRQ